MLLDGVEVGVHRQEVDELVVDEPERDAVGEPQAAGVCEQKIILP